MYADFFLIRLEFLLLRVLRATIVASINGQSDADQPLPRRKTCRAGLRHFQLHSREIECQLLSLVKPIINI